MLKEKEKLDLGKHLLIRAFTSDETKKQDDRVLRGVHHIFVLDCSGSMYYQLAQIRADLYN